MRLFYLVVPNVFSLLDTNFVNSVMKVLIHKSLVLYSSSLLADRAVIKVIIDTQNDIYFKEMAQGSKVQSNTTTTDESFSVMNGARSGAVNHAPRRSKDLKIMAKELLTQSLLTDESFEKFWNQLFSYGCHCFDHGSDRPLSTMGSGKPRDQLDAACRNYKRCQACATQHYGSECISELVEYDYISIGGEDEPLRHFQVKDDFNSCAHKIFECDHRFATELLDYHTIDEQFTIVDSKSGWNRSASCFARRHDSSVRILL